MEEHDAYMLLMGALERRVLDRFESIQREVDLARATIDRRLESMNEFREELRRVQSSFITREELELRAASMNSRVISLEKLAGRWWGIVLAVGSIAGMVGAFIRSLFIGSR